MRIAFYAPLKAPSHAVPSGDRRVARLFVDLLERAGYEVALASELRTYEPVGGAMRQASLREKALAEASALVAQWSGDRAMTGPDVWFTYHSYYKAPDWIGPHVSRSLGIPYVIAEASYAPKRAHGAWALGHDAAGDAIRSASLLLCPTHDDIDCIAPLVSARQKVIWLPPFLDPDPYVAATRVRVALREELLRQHHLDPSVPWIAVVAMMRPGDKAASYRVLATSLAMLADVPFHVLVAGDGEARGEVEAALKLAAPGRTVFLGELEAEEVASLYAASDLCLWPAVNEAFGMAMLEAQAAGLPVVSRAVRGVADVVLDGTTGLLSPPDDEMAFAQCARELLTDPVRRSAMGRAAACFAGIERSLDSTVARLNKAFQGLAPVRGSGMRTRKG